MRVVLAVRVYLEQVADSDFMGMFYGAANRIAFSAVAAVGYDRDIVVFLRDGVDEIFIDLVVSVVHDNYGKAVLVQRGNYTLQRVSVIVNWNYKSLQHCLSFPKSERSARKNLAFVACRQFVSVGVFFGIVF